MGKTGGGRGTNQYQVKGVSRDGAGLSQVRCADAGLLTGHIRRGVAAQSWPEGSRFIDVVFIQGDEATDILDMIDENGYERALEHLTQWDDGETTTRASLINHGDQESLTPAWGDGDTVYVSDAGPGETYVLAVNWRMGCVSLNRVMPPSNQIGDDAVRPG